MNPSRKDNSHLLVMCDGISLPTSMLATSFENVLQLKLQKTAVNKLFLRDTHTYFSK